MESFLFLFLRQESPSGKPCAGPGGFEPPTYSLGGCRSIQTELRAHAEREDRIA